MSTVDNLENSHDGQMFVDAQWICYTHSPGKVGNLNKLDAIYLSGGFKLFLFPIISVIILPID